MRALVRRLLLENPSVTPFWLLLGLWTIFSIVSPQFRRPGTLLQIFEYSAPTAILAIGMTFVLLTAGIDLSVGAIMLVAAAVGGKMLVAGFPAVAAISAMLLVGVVWGLLNGLLIARLRMTGFIVTLAMMFVGRGIGLWITQTRPVTLPESFRELADSSLLAITTPVWLMVASVIVAHLVLSKTQYGRQVHAFGFSHSTARVAGLPVKRLESSVYVICSAFASLAAVISLSQINVVSPTMGSGRELEAIAAAVLGGVSLFGGRGGPAGAAMGALLFQSVYTGLNTLDADRSVGINVSEYSYPLITAGIVFVAVLIDSTRKARFDAAQRPFIRPQEIRTA